MNTAPVDQTSLTFEQLLKSCGFDDEQMKQSMTGIQDSMQHDILSSLLNKLSESDLKVLNSLKTKGSIQHFLSERIPHFEDLIQSKVTAFHNELAEKVTALKEDTNSQNSAVSSAEQPQGSGAPQTLNQTEESQISQPVEPQPAHPVTATINQPAAVDTTISPAPVSPVPTQQPSEAQGISPQPSMQVPAPAPLPKTDISDFKKQFVDIVK